jgi:(S)-3,5-dihydroxyphenylglycine transaminase
VIGAVRTAELIGSDLHGSLQDPVLTSMNLLNEIALRYPQAVSFAAGRPYEDFFDIADLHGYLRAFVDHLGRELGQSAAEVRRTLFQYGRTKGIVHELVAQNLAVDEGIAVDPEAIVVTVGCQEGMFLALRALRRDERDVALAVAPTYVGLPGAAQLVDMPVLPVAGGPSGVDVSDLVHQIRSARAAGLRPRVCYVMPDFANPSGLSLDLATRRALLDVADSEDILLLEDNPYGLFHSGADRVPTLKALDGRQRVVYLGSFAKTVLPGARVGYVVADQRVDDGSGQARLFADELSKIKSMVTVNTSPITQAIVGGKLLTHDYSLLAGTAAERELYGRNRRQVLDGLAGRFPVGPDGTRAVSWNAPAGGFFVVLDVSFRADDALLEHSARRHGLLWTPMHHFYGGSGGYHQLRLSVSLLTPEEIETGLDRLKALIDEAGR